MIDPALVVRGPVSAVDALRHPAITKQHKQALQWKRRHRAAVLVPCAQQKPYRESRSHRVGYLPALEGKPVDVWVVSDLSGVIPYGWSDRYPNDAYEFAPQYVRGQAREILVERMRQWMRRQGTHYERVYLAVPQSYMDLLLAAGAGLRVGLVDASITRCRQLGACPRSHFRATSSAYVRFLRATIR